MKTMENDARYPAERTINFETLHPTIFNGKVVSTEIKPQKSGYNHKPSLRLIYVSGNP